MHEHPSEWAEPFRQIGESARRAEQALTSLSEHISRGQVADNASPRVEPSKLVATALADLGEALSTIQRAQVTAWNRFTASPLESLVRGTPLSPEQYYLLSAMGVVRATAKHLGLSEWDDHEAFTMLHYEDDGWSGYINPAEQPRDVSSNRAGLQFGRPPEELPVRGLRPEQRRFFEQHLPTVLARFAHE
jgi:hypothetical protein